MTPDDLKHALARAWKKGWDARDAHIRDTGTEWHKQKALSIFLAHEDLSLDDETRRLILGALQAEK